MANVRFQQESYKRGMVLGLTMAEIVLLILFALLLALAALLKENERDQSRMTAEIALMEKELSRLSGDQISDPKKFFEELIIAKKTAAEADRLEKQLQEAKQEQEKLQAALIKERAAHGQGPRSEP